MSEMTREEMERENQRLMTLRGQRGSNGLERVSKVEIPPPPEPKVCEKCGEVHRPFFVEWRKEWVFPTLVGGCQMCATMENARVLANEQTEQTLRKYGLLDGVYAHMLFGTYYPDPKYPSQAEAVQAAYNVIEQWQQGHWEKGIRLFSPLYTVGVGKTHLAISMARVGCAMLPVVPGRESLAVWDMPTYISGIKSSYNNGNTDEIQRSVTEPMILVMDDLGTEHVVSTTWYQSLLYELINARWLSRKATLVTTNLNNEQLGIKIGPRCWSRLKAMTGTEPVTIDGEDYRAK